MSCAGNVQKWHSFPPPRPPAKVDELTSIFITVENKSGVYFVGEPMEAEARVRASNEDGDIKRISTKEWAKSTGYDPVKLFTKVRFTLWLWIRFVLRIVYEVELSFLSLILSINLLI